MPRTPRLKARKMNKRFAFVMVCSLSFVPVRRRTRVRKRVRHDSLHRHRHGQTDVDDRKKRVASIMFMIKNSFIFTASVLCVVTLIIPSVSAKICGTIDVRNQVSNLNSIKNCTEITGNLYIVLLGKTKSEADYNGYVFPELKKITGYVLLYKLTHFPSLGKLFPNLRLIRGLTLFENYALILYDLPSIKEIGTTKLSYIARGYIKIGKAPQLCYADTIDWKKIGPDGYLHDQPYKQSCPPCPAHCNGFCWNQEKCQIFTDGCHIECLGCTQKNSSAHCEVCKNYDNDGECVAECPPNKYILEESAKCVSQEECLARNINTINTTLGSGGTFTNTTTGDIDNTLKANKISSNKTVLWFVYDRECRTECPEDTEFDQKLRNCKPCRGYCIKYCEGVDLKNEIVIENMKGCTHINGSLSISSLKSTNELNSLYKYLRSLRYIRDYLFISRNPIIEDLNFMPNLTEIGGVNLYSLVNKALIAHDNRNLRKLWNITSDFSLTIKNGTIGLYNNEQLCLSEIEKFAYKIGINYSDTDVSRYSNGAFCEDSSYSEVAANITELNSKNVTIVWDRKYGDNELYYTVHYTDSNNTEKKQDDLCKVSGWSTLTTTNNSAQLLNLKPFQTYYFYIKTYLEKGKHKNNSMQSFQTLPDDPDSPSVFAAYTIDNETIRLVWTKPHHSNGNFSNYIINIYREYDDFEITKKRDYCEHPFTNAGKEIDSDTNEEETTPISNEEPPQRTIPDPSCYEDTVETDIRLENVWLFLCDKKSQSKYGVDYCKNYYYDYFDNSSDIQVHKRSGEKSSRKKSSLNFRNRNFTTIIVEADRTNYTVRNLNKFSLYIFYIIACNEEYQGRKLCSPVLQAWARTRKNINSDDVPNFSADVMNQFDVIVKWDKPKNPNGFIVSYNVYYTRDVEHSKNQTECISQERFLKEGNVTLRNMLPGSYYIGVQAVSLAGPGNIREFKKIKIGQFHPLWLKLAIFFILTLIALAIIIYYFRIKNKRMLDHMQLIPNINPEYTPIVYEPDEWEMEREDIELHQIVGQGTFGRVFLGHIKSRNMACAVKTVNEEASFHDRMKFLNEASTMKGFTNGAHVVKLFGVVSKSQPPLAIMELMGLGDLKKYLLRLAELLQSITSNEIYRMAIEIADGLAYLTSRKFVHRDLAARNCMVSNDKTIKIGDFGMTRDIYQSDYYRKGSGSALLPVRWMAPESIADGVNTYDSDIWSYGIVLWEIVTLASQPYQGLSNEEVTQFVVSKGTLNRPAECPNLLWEIMAKCWDWYPTRRPTCFEIIEILQDHVGLNFKSLSFYHSQGGQEYLISQGSERANNLPALAIGEYHSEENAETENSPLNVIEAATSQRGDFQFIPPSSPVQEHKLSREFH